MASTSRGRSSRETRAFRREEEEGGPGPARSPSPFRGVPDRGPDREAADRGATARPVARPAKKKLSARMSTGGRYQAHHQRRHHGEGTSRWSSGRGDPSPSTSGKRRGASTSEVNSVEGTSSSARKKARYSSTGERREGPAEEPVAGPSRHTSRARRMRKELRGSVLQEDPGDMRRQIRELEEAKSKVEKKLETRRREQRDTDRRMKEAMAMAREARAAVEQLKAEADTSRREQVRKERALDQMGDEIRQLRKRAEKAELDKAKAESARMASTPGGSSEGFFQDVLLNFKELVETNLQCSICSELFVFATTISCGHSFCEDCIEEWKSKKEHGRPNCPICRTDIHSTTSTIIMDTYVDKAVDNFFPEDAKRAREVLVEERRVKKRGREEQRAAGPSRRRRRSHHHGHEEGEPARRRRRHPAGHDDDEDRRRDRRHRHHHRRGSFGDSGRAALANSIRIYLSRDRRGPDPFDSDSSSDFSWDPNRTTFSPSSSVSSLSSSSSTALSSSSSEFFSDNSGSSVLHQDDGEPRGDGLDFDDGDGGDRDHQDSGDDVSSTPATVASSSPQAPASEGEENIEVDDDDDDDVAGRLVDDLLTDSFPDSSPFLGWGQDDDGEYREEEDGDWQEADEDQNQWSEEEEDGNDEYGSPEWSDNGGSSD